MKKRKSLRKSKAEQNFKDLEIVLIHWEDASYERGELKTEDIKQELELVTAGFLVKVTKTHVTTAMDYDPKLETWRHLSHIPKKMILSMEKVR